MNTALSGFTYNLYKSDLVLLSAGTCCSKLTEHGISVTYVRLGWLFYQSCTKWEAVSEGYLQESRSYIWNKKAVNNLTQYGAYPQYVSIQSYSTLCYKRRHWLAYIGLQTLAFDQRVYVWVRSNGIVYFLYMKYVVCILLYIVACTLCSLVLDCTYG